MMDSLLDSHVMLWSMAQPERLSTKARALIESAESTLNFSIASLWEISVKLSIGKIAQASVERLTLVSTDVIFDKYGVTRVW